MVNYLDDGLDNDLDDRIDNELDDGFGDVNEISFDIEIDMFVNKNGLGSYLSK